MKPTLLITLSFLFALITYIQPSFSYAAVEQVGKVSISIKPAIFGAAGGGVRLGRTGNLTCPVTVLQDYSEVINGMSVEFTILYTCWLVERDCEGNKQCPQMVAGDGEFPRDWIGIVGVGDHEGKKLINGRFIIERHDDLSYKLVFCPNISGATCSDVGRYDDEDGRRLVLTNNNDPFQIVFVDATNVDDATI
ncbi:hypothetical protein AAHE18_05G167500 [Arachis hypogaea]